MRMPRMLALVFPLVLFGEPSALQGQQREAFSAPAWTRGAVCYEIFVRSFYDSDGDGVGDLRGLIQKLDYINDGDPTSRRDLGATCIWLMPIAQSPSYHGYDVTDYYRIDREYGTNEDFRLLVLEAHRRGIRVLVDLVLNHVSSEHPHFQDALHNVDSPYRDWFIWLPSHPGVKNPWGGDNWHRSIVRDEYYYGFFWHGMPDLNYETPAVRDEAKEIATFWLKELGVDGFRLDAVSFLTEEESGRVVQHAPLTHAVLRELAGHVRRVAPDAYTVGEVWDSTGAMLSYYPDQLDAYFAFEASDAIIESVREGSARTLLQPFLRLQRELPAERWAPFLRNHDQTRTVTALGGDVARAKVAATLLLTLPGLPFVYYGEEIGMSGDKPDPRLRTPMHWTRGPAVGFTDGLVWEPLQQDSLTANVEVQDADPNSLLSLYRRLIHLRAEHPALANGALVSLSASTNAAAAYVRREGNRSVLVVANLGTTPLSSVRLSSETRVLPAGRYDAQNLLGGPQGASLTVRGDGRIDSYVPLRSLGSLESYVFGLTEVGR
ncbi:MAG: alpha-amylase family glycosyl hydrolase [Gemmatimonadota bacterium]|nr:alpha-amylase family glycosyl hydrolase [Gemmatimonadota bacterium]